jgi:hypothetical protein
MTGENMSPQMTGARAGATPRSGTFDGSLIELVEAIRQLPYGRPSDRTVAGMLADGRGTCSTKHLFLAQLLAERLPTTTPQIIHRVYRVDRPSAERLFGRAVAAAVPPGGLIDVHRYLEIRLGGRSVRVDATFPGETWDGRSSLPLACGPGVDIPAGDAPDEEKRVLEERHCDPAVREPFIAALAAHDSLPVAWK